MLSTNGFYTLLLFLLLTFKKKTLAGNINFSVSFICELIELCEITNFDFQVFQKLLSLSVKVTNLLIYSSK